MPLNKPEDVSEKERPPEESEMVPKGELPEVELNDLGEYELDEAVEMLDGKTGESVESIFREMGRLERKIESQREAIAELVEAIEMLSDQQGDILSEVSGTQVEKTVDLEDEKLSGIYDPTEEFRGGRNDG